jgi:DNA-binding response OmpR family regulator
VTKRCSSGGKILIIEDDLLLSEILATFLNSAGYETSRAESSMHGISKAVAERPDLILTDLHLPDMIAVEAIVKLKNNANTSDIPVIVLTAEQDREWKHKALEAGAVEYFIKPISLADLLQLVATFCRPLP